MKEQTQNRNYTTRKLGFTRSQVGEIIKLFLEKYATGKTAEEMRKNLENGYYQFIRNL